MLEDRKHLPTVRSHYTTAADIQQNRSSLSAIDSCDLFPKQGLLPYVHLLEFPHSVA
jgi:hypothetical protein